MNVVVRVVKIEQAEGPSSLAVANPGRPSGPPVPQWIYTLRPADQTVAAGALAVRSATDLGFHLGDQFTFSLTVPEPLPVPAESAPKARAAHPRG